MSLPPEVQSTLKTASRVARTSPKQFKSLVCGNEWDRFIEKWAGISYAFVADALGGYHTEPLETILPMSDADHAAGANASFNIVTGQVTLHPGVIDGKPGITLEKITHEFTHGALAGFPEGDPFTEEGYVDYSVWVMAHAPVWNPWGREMVKAAAFNIKVRRERAFKNQSDYDRKRWAGGMFASAALGPQIIAHLKMKKMEGNLQW